MVSNLLIKDKFYNRKAHVFHFGATLILLLFFDGSKVKNYSGNTISCPFQSLLIDRLSKASRDKFNLSGTLILLLSGYASF